MSFRVKLKRIFKRTKTKNIWPSYVSIGKHTYGINKNMVAGLSPEAPSPLEIIALLVLMFCSFQRQITLLTSRQHTH